MLDNDNMNMYNNTIVHNINDIIFIIIVIIIYVTSCETQCNSHSEYRG